MGRQTRPGRESKRLLTYSEIQVLERANKEKYLAEIKTQQQQQQEQFIKVFPYLYKVFLTKLIKAHNIIFATTYFVYKNAKKTIRLPPGKNV